MLTLWDVIETPVAAAARPAKRPKAKSASAEHRPEPAEPAAAPACHGPFDAIVRTMLGRYGVRVRKWRRSSTGLASLVQKRNGAIERWVESPRPTTPLALSIFLHEIGHHALGIGAIRPRCLEEYHAWQFAFAAMREHSVPVNEKVLARYERAMRYAVGKAARRNIRSLPQELLEFAREPMPIVLAKSNPRRVGNEPNYS